MKGALQRSLPESYYAQSSYRFWLEYTQRHIEPDVEVVRSARRPEDAARAGALPWPNRNQARAVRWS